MTIELGGGLALGIELGGVTGMSEELRGVTCAENREECDKQ